MAFKLLKPFFPRLILTRTYAGAEACPIGGTSDYEVYSTTTPSGILVTAAENNAAISRISIGYRAGLRNESRDNVGAVQVLKNCVGNSTKNATRFFISTHLQQSGGSISIQADREALIYTLMGTRKSIEKALPFLTEIATQPAFKPWEVATVIGLAKKEAESCPQSCRILDLVHKAAYRGVGLGNLEYPSGYQFGKLNSETLQQYFADYCTAGRMAVVGLGVHQEDLVAFAQGLEIPDGDDSVDPSPYKGGELRQDGPGGIAHVAIAGEGASLKNPKEVLALQVLQKVFGSGPSLKYGSQSGIISKAIGQDAQGYSLKCFNFNYSDSGLFGVVISAPSDSIEKVVRAACQTLKDGCIEDEEISKGLNGMKIGMMMACENTNSAFDNLVRSSVLLGSAQSPGDCNAAVEEVNEDEVKKALSKIAGSKLTVVALGDVGDVPYGDELGC